MSKDINNKLCPFCKTDNQCQVDGRTCWCFDVAAPNALVNLAAENISKEHCICLSCINKYKKDPVKFQQGLKKIQ